MQVDAGRRGTTRGAEGAVAMSGLAGADPGGSVQASVAPVTGLRAAMQASGPLPATMQSEVGTSGPLPAEVQSEEGTIGAALSARGTAVAASYAAASTVPADVEHLSEDELASAGSAER